MASDKLENLLPKNFIPSHWEQISCNSNENQLTLILGHINPENNIDPLFAKGETTAKVNGTVATVHGLSTQKGSMTGFFNTMMESAQTGLIPGLTPDKIQNLRTQFNSISNEKYDIQGDITVIKYENEQAARQVLLSYKGGPAGVMNGQIAASIPGGKALSELFKSEQLKGQMSEDQIKKLEEFEQLSKKAAKQSKQEMAKDGIRYTEDKCLGYPAVYLERENPDYARYFAPKPKSPPKSFVGGGFDTMVKFPPRSKPGPPPKIIRTCMGLQVGNFILSGTLVSSLEIMPSGNTFCQALTRHEKKVVTEKVEGKTYSTTHILPVNSTYANEGYFYKEEVEKMILAVISKLKSV